MKRTLIFALLSAAVLTMLSCGKKSKDGLDMVKIPGKNFEMLRTEVTQELYESVMGENPSWFQFENEELDKEEKEALQKICGDDTSKLPVDQVSWYDAIYFCNKLSEMKGYKPVYSVDGETDTSKWNYTPHNGDKIEGKVSQDKNANGFRLPTSDEWEYVALGGKDYIYAGSDNLDKVGWYTDNSNNVTHPVATKNPNGYGLYDMSGNVEEWVWDYKPRRPDFRYRLGGNYYYDAYSCELDYRYDDSAYEQSDRFGFRLLRTTENTSQKKKAKVELDMVKIPEKNFEMLRTEVTQRLYESVMEENPSWVQLGNEELRDEEKKALQKICGNDTSNLPVEWVSWYDAIYFCNKLSEMKGLKPVYSVDGETDTSKWDYRTHRSDYIEGEVSQDKDANGFRLPTNDEWEYVARGGQNYKYAGSNNLDEIGWYKDNCNNVTHPVATKKPNGYGLYDMSGNVSEWVWDSAPDDPDERSIRGGDYECDADRCGVSSRDYFVTYYAVNSIGFRIVHNTK